MKDNFLLKKVLTIVGKYIKMQLVRRDKKMMNAEELSRKLNKHINTIYNWIKKGMPCIKTEKDYLINYDEVIEWLKNNDKRG